ncbi:MAG: NCS2 family permease [Alphaproteobacteria bacterium]|nr:NCS2 family permease [Alphaproteobacteria bacterium]
MARWFVRGDIDGFFGLAVDNLVQLLVIDALCRFVLGFPAELVYGRVLPAAALSILVGNLFYSWQAMRLARKTGRDDVCALPYGINTPSVFAYVFLVMLPTKLATGDAHAAWQAGLLAAFGSGIIELFGAFGAGWLRRVVPRAALLSTLAGIALTFISLGFLFRTFASPLVGLSTLVVVSLVYFGRLRFKGGIPGGLVAVLVGMAIAWARGIAPVGEAPDTLGLYLPVPAVGDLWAALSGPDALTWLSVIVPMGLFNLIGSLQNLESAAAAGDDYETTPSLAANGIGTLVGALFGSAFPTTIYIGHPGWKALGARIGYSWLDGIVMAALCLTGTLGWIAWAVPIEAGMAIVLWIGIVITAQAFQATPRAHAPAVVVGLLPGVAAWGAMMIKGGVRAASGIAGVDSVFGPELGAALTRADVYADGAFALEQGFILTAMILAAAVVGMIEGRFRVAAAWLGVGALFSATGLMHGWSWGFADTVLKVGPFAAGEAAAAYAVGAVLCLLAPLVADRREDAQH